MEKILRNEQENEETNERASERIEQKFMNEILSTREIEENPLFRHDNRLFRQFYNRKSPMKMCKNGDFRHISGIFGKNVCEKNQKKQAGCWLDLPDDES